MKKVAKVKGEFHAMNLETRLLLKALDVLAENADAVAVAVVCGRTEPVERWGRATFEEYDLWRELLIEASLPLVSNEVSHIFPDRPKYKTSLQRIISSQITESLARRCSVGSIPVTFRNSHELPGIQIADAVSHSVYRSLMPQDDAPLIRETLDRLKSSGQLLIRPIELVETRPDYLVTPIEVA